MLLSIEFLPSKTTSSDATDRTDVNSRSLSTSMMELNSSGQSLGNERALSLGMDKAIFASLSLNPFDEHQYHTFPLKLVFLLRKLNVVAYAFARLCSGSGKIHLGARVHLVWCSRSLDFLESAYKHVSGLTLGM
ncbi:hypothetical protein Tco_1067804 [Tanacetum coccineum]|uniref:Uncharacterized protein n=1 Tax=Tanacetum coccineum TaxID=301880 RepID=A0ABQ5HDX3_9ASTR